MMGIGVFELVIIILVGLFLLGIPIAIAVVILLVLLKRDDSTTSTRESHHRGEE